MGDTPRKEVVMSEERLVDIEVKLAHQEQTIVELNDAVTEQQAKITELEALCNRLIDRVRSISDSATDAPHDDRPPHY